VITIFLICLFCSNTSYHFSSVTGWKLLENQALMMSRVIKFRLISSN
jgi:hypothetical protein